MISKSAVKALFVVLLASSLFAYSVVVDSIGTKWFSTEIDVACYIIEGDPPVIFQGTKTKCRVNLISICSYDLNCRY